MARGSRWILALFACGVGFLAGRAGSDHDLLRPAEGGAYWDAARSAYVTGDGENICFWRVDASGQVIDLSWHHATFAWVPGADGTHQERGWLSSGTATPGPRPAPAAAAPAPAAPQGGAACGAGGKACGK